MENGTSICWAPMKLLLTTVLKRKTLPSAASLALEAGCCKSSQMLVATDTDMGREEVGEEGQSNMELRVATTPQQRLDRRVQTTRSNHMTTVITLETAPYARDWRRISTGVISVAEGKKAEPDERDSKQGKNRASKYF